MSRRLQLFVPTISLDRTTGTSLQRQIYRQVAGAIRSETIPYDARVPSTRVMARLLGVSRNTVLAAYDDLAADGLLRGERGAGMLVNRTGNGSRPAWFGLQHVIRAASYPARVITFTDADGNSLYLRH